MLVKSPPFPTSCVPFPRFSHFPSSSPQICPDPKLPLAILFYLTRQLIAFSFLQSTQLIKCSFPAMATSPIIQLFHQLVSSPSPHFPLSHSHSHQLALSLCPDDPHLPSSCQLSCHWPPAQLQQALPANPDGPLSGRPAALLTNSNA